VGPRKPAQHAAATAARGCPGAAGQRGRQGADAQTGHGNAPGQPGLRELPQTDGPDRLRAENFDAIGGYRARYADADAPVDASGLLFDGSEFQTAEEFRREFMKHADRVVHTVTEKVLTYSLGRGLEYYDQPTVRAIVRASAEENYTWSSLIYRRATSHDDI
jgi:hypothetical protein